MVFHCHGINGAYHTIHKCIIIPRKDPPPLSDSDSNSDSGDFYSAASKQSSKTNLSLNFKEGKAAQVLDRIVQQYDIQSARERIATEQKKGESVRKQLEKAKKLTAGWVWKSGTNRLGPDVINACLDASNKKVQDEKDKMIEAEKKYLEAKAAADTLLSEKDFDINKTSVKNIAIILKAYRREGDKKIPTKKKDMLTCWSQWKERPPLTFDYSAIDAKFQTYVESNNDQNESITGFATV